MLCRNCGKPVSEQAAVCMGCGSPPRAGNKFCWSCGAETPPQAAVCLKCGVSLGSAGEVPKQRLTAGLLSLLLPLVCVGGMGRIYLGYTTLGVIQLVVGIVTCGVGGLWSMIDGVLILAGNPDRDAKGNPLK
jgi:TM2 domain-containing membrane protein YozV